MSTLAELPSATLSTTRNFYPLSATAAAKTPVLLLRGAADTIGLEVTASLEKVFTAAGVPVEFRLPENELTHEEGLTSETIDMFQGTSGIAIKGPYFTPIGCPTTSLNIDMRTKLDLFANVVHAHNIPGVTTRHSGVDVVIIRENTEGEYSGLEYSIQKDIITSLKIITYQKSMRIARYAFEYALANGRKKVTCIHKANIMKSADGLFLDCCTEVSKEYPSIEFEAMIVDNTCMQMTSKPQQFDVMLLPNLYGNIVTNIATGLVGGPGLFPGVNIGINGAVFEQGARHSGRDIAGKQIANPTATIRAGALMLRHLKMNSPAEKIEKAVHAVYADTKLRTKDVLLEADHKLVTTDEFTDAVIQRL